MFEVIRKLKNKHETIEEEFVLAHDNEVVENLNIYVPEDSYKLLNKYVIESTNQYETKFLIDFSLEDFRVFTIQLNLFEWLKLDNYFWNVEIITANSLERNQTFDNIYFKFEPDLAYWNKMFSFLEYKDLFVKYFYEFNTLSERWIRTWDEEFTEIIIGRNNDVKDISIREFLNEDEQLIKFVHKKTVEELSQKNREPSIFTIFNFPSELKIHCEQYLLYFAQFLQDLGINATSNLKEEAGKVLFSVTPTDDVEALDKIRKALALYLNLPSSPIIYNDSFASIRLQAEIERLQSSQRIAEMEFRVAHKALENQDKIIHQQSVLLEQQAKVIEKITDKAVMINSAENKEELEKICEGLEIGESKFIKEQLGIKFNPAKVVKTIVKNTLGNGDEIIELGLDKKDSE